MIPTDEDDGTDYEEVADTLVALGQTSEGINAYRQALSRGASAALWQKLGDAYVKAGDDARGAKCLVESIAMDPVALDAHKSLAKIALAKNDGKGARVHAEEVVKRAPNDVAGHRLLGRSFLQQAMWKEAIAEMNLVLDQRPDDAYAHNNVGFAALQIGDLDTARDHLERCLSLEPQHGYMFNNLGVAYERLGRRAEAHAAFSRAAELSPKYAVALVNKNRVRVALSTEEQIESDELLLSMRTPPIDGGAVPASMAVDDTGGDLVDAGVESVPGSDGAGGSARLAPTAE
jgi:tetratricopeptide (TPR) repeat protein